MLAKDYKFHFVNSLGVDMDLSSNSANEIVTLDLLSWKLGASGVLSYGTKVDLTYSAGDIADGGSAEFTGQDNSSDLRYGLHGVFDFLTDDATASGTVDLYVEFAVDGGTVFPSDAADFVPTEDLIYVCSLQIAGDGAGYKRSTSFELLA